MSNINVTPGAGLKLRTTLYGDEHTPWRMAAEIDSAGDPFIPGMGTVTTTYSRTSGLVTGEVRVSVVAGVTRTKTITYARTGGVVTGVTESAWVRS